MDLDGGSFYKRSGYCGSKKRHKKMQAHEYLHWMNCNFRRSTVQQNILQTLSFYYEQTFVNSQYREDLLMDRILEQLYENLNQAKVTVNECARAVADLSNSKDQETQLEKLIEYNYQKGLVTGIEDTIHEVEKMLSVTRSLKAV